MPLLLHGDAAFPGQGVVAETLNLQSLDGYSTGGTIHIITDNQVGFTTDPEEGRSTPYASDMAKGFNVPIIHVNADDVEACIAAIRLAMAYRERWSRDVVIDLIGYRRYGHNETDEPAYTQPTMAAQIKEHPPVCEIYAEQLVEGGRHHGGGRRDGERGAPRGAAGRSQGAAAKIEAGEFESETSTAIGTGGARPHQEPRGRHRGLRAAAGDAERRAAEGAGELHDPPQAAQAAGQRGLDAIDEGGIDFGHAEALAFASLLTEGDPRPAHRPGHRARHVLPPSPGLLRREDRARLRADPAPLGRPGSDRAPQQPAVGDRLRRLRVRLFGRVAREPHPLGGAVRRLRECRAGDHRQLHRRPGSRSGARPRA